jgi:replicative DNA helicase
MIPHKKRGKELVEDKGLPFADDAEKGVLSCLMQNPELVGDVQGLLSDKAFYHPANKLVYQTMLELHAQKKPVELITLSTHFIDHGLMEKIGGPGFLAEINSFVNSPQYYPHHISLLKEKLVYREIITSCNDTIDEAYDPQDGAQGLLDRFYQRAATCANQNALTKEISIEDATDQWMDTYQKMMIGEIKTSIPTRFSCVNERAPLRPGYTVIMGPRKSGKSCLGFNFITDSCLREGRPGIIANYELQFQESMNRLIADYGNVDARYLFSPDVYTPRRAEMEAITKSITVIRESKLQIICNVRMSLEELCNRARAKHAKHGDLVVLIDYLQILPDPRVVHKERNREQDVARNSGMARDLSKELNIPVIALSQINKDGTTRESGAPENDCDLALRVDGEEGVKIHAQRNGASGGHLPLFLQGEHFRFREEYRTSEIPV